MIPSINMTPKLPTVFHQPCELPENVTEAIKEFFPHGMSELKVTPLKMKGNCVVRVERGSDSFVLRQSFPTWTVERCQREIEIARWVADSHAGPQVLNVSKDSRFMLLEYFSGGVLNPNEPIDLQEVARSLHNLHALGLPPSMREEKESTSFKRFEGQFGKLTENLPQEIQNLYRQVKEIERNFYRKKQNFVLCHLDLHCHNMMKHEGRIMLVDYGMTGPDHPFMDLANFSMYMGLSYEDELHLLHHYLQGDHSRVDEYFFIRPIVYLNKITWPLIEGFKLGGTSEMLAKVWQGEETKTMVEHFEVIYNQGEHTPLERFHYAHVAYLNFMEGM